MIKFYLVGDTHGDLSFASRICKAAEADGVDTIYQLGDFGVWPGDSGQYYLDTLSENAGKRGVTWKVTLGNHEDYDQLDQIAGVERGSFNLRENIRILGYKAGVWQHGDIRFACIGGAVSIDRNMRMPHVSYWPQETIKDVDLWSLETQMGFWKWDGVDILLSHDAPTSIPTWDGFIKNDSWSNANREQMDLAYDIARPRFGFHGHYHKYLNYTHDYRGGRATVVGLGANPPAMVNRWDEQSHNSVMMGMWEDGNLLVSVANGWVSR